MAIPFRLKLKIGPALGAELGFLRMHPEFGWMCALRWLPNGGGLALLPGVRGTRSQRTDLASRLLRNEPTGVAWIGAPATRDLVSVGEGPSKLLKTKYAFEIILPPGDPRRYHRFRIAPLFSSPDTFPSNLHAEMVCLGPTAWALYTPGWPLNTPTTKAPRYRQALGRGRRFWNKIEAGLIGCGGLGSILAPELLALGIGKLWLIDGEKVEPENLGGLFGKAHIGRPKVEALAAILGDAGERIMPVPFAAPSCQMIHTALRKSDLWVDAAANPALSTYLAARAATEGKWYLRVGTLARRRDSGSDVVLAVPGLPGSGTAEPACQCFFSLTTTRRHLHNVHQLQRKSNWPALTGGADGRQGRLHGVNHAAAGLALSLLEQLSKHRIESTWVRMYWDVAGNLSLERKKPLPGICPVCASILQPDGKPVQNRG